MSSKKVNTCAKLLSKNGYDIAFIESATAGLMCSQFSLTEFSGDILCGGVVCYAVPVKEQILKVPPNIIKTYSPESEEVTAALANGGMTLFKTNVIVAVTGLPAEGGSESPEKPVGTMFLHIIINATHLKHREVFHGTPSEIMLETTDRAADIITSHLKKT